MEKTNLVAINGGLTAAGNLQNGVRDEIREQSINKFLPNFEKTAKGKYVLPVAEVDGKTVYAVATLSVSVADNLFDEPKPKGDKDAAEETAIPEIFGE